MRFLGVSTETWSFINGFAPWLSAIGTLVAVWTSLYLALADRTKLRVTVYRAKYAIDRQIIPVGDRQLVLLNDDQFFITFVVTNPRGPEVFVDSMYWSVGKTRIEQRLDLTSFSSYHDSPNMPSIPGLIGKIPGRRSFSSADFQERQLPLLAPQLLKDVSPIKVGVRTSTGKNFEGKIDGALEDWLRSGTRAASAG